jgi:hypothetical protein
VTTKRLFPVPRIYLTPVWMMAGCTKDMSGGWRRLIGASPFLILALSILFTAHLLCYPSPLRDPTVHIPHKLLVSLPCTMFCWQHPFYRAACLKPHLFLFNKLTYHFDSGAMVWLKERHPCCLTTILFLLDGLRALYLSPLPLRLHPFGVPCSRSSSLPLFLPLHSHLEGASNYLSVPLRERFAKGRTAPYAGNPSMLYCSRRTVKGIIIIIIIMIFKALEYAFVTFGPQKAPHQ